MQSQALPFPPQVSNTAPPPQVMSDMNLQQHLLENRPKPPLTSKSVLQQQIDNYNKLLKQNRLKSPVNDPLPAQPVAVAAPVVATVAPPPVQQPPAQSAVSSYKSLGSSASLISSDSKDQLQEKILKYKAMLKEKQLRQQQITDIIRGTARSYTAAICKEFNLLSSCEDDQIRNHGQGV